jgi:hypothetical protein
VVKALNQFGTLSHVSAVVTRSCSYSNELPGTQAQCDPAVMRGFVTGVATYDWSHAVYHSRYLIFVHKDLIDQNLQMRQTLTPLERSLFTRTVAFTGFSNWHDTVWHTAIDEQSGGNQSGGNGSRWSSFPGTSRPAPMSPSKVICPMSPAGRIYRSPRSSSLCRRAAPRAPHRPR